jgi:hypothetical protein
MIFDLTLVLIFDLISDHACVARLACLACGTRSGCSGLHHIAAVGLALVQDVLLELLGLASVIRLLLALGIALALVVLLALVEIVLFQLATLGRIINHIVAAIGIDLQEAIIEHALDMLMHDLSLPDLLLGRRQRRLHLLPLLQLILNVMSLHGILQLVLHDLGLAAPPDG